LNLEFHDECYHQVAALHVLLSFVKQGPEAGTLDKSLLAHIVRHSLCNKHFRSGLLEPLCEKYLSQYDDLLLLILNGVRHVLVAHNGDKTAADSDEEEGDAKKAAKGAASLPKVSSTVCYKHHLDNLES